jgi:hypothetical protein
MYSSRIDIYDTIAQAWTTAELTVTARDGMAVASVGDKIFFAGGGDNDWFDVTSRIDIYNSTTNTWSTAELSQARKYLAAVTLGSKVFFAGGGYWGPLSGPPPNPNWPQNANYYVGSTVVDIYDNAMNGWSTANLSEGRFELSATAAGSKIYFAGGLNNINSGSRKIDIYDAEANSWSASELQEEKASHGAIAFGNKIMWAAGANTPYYQGYNRSNRAEIRDQLTGLSTTECITPKALFGVVRKNDDVIFFTGLVDGPARTFDIYNITTGTWSTGTLPVSIHGSTIIAVNNTIYVAGGIVDGGYSDKVWKLEF